MDDAIKKYQMRRDRRVRERMDKACVHEDYGVKGMKWGHHKAKQETGGAGRSGASADVAKAIDGAKFIDNGKDPRGKKTMRMEIPGLGEVVATRTRRKSGYEDWDYQVQAQSKKDGKSLFLNHNTTVKSTEELEQAVKNTLRRLRETDEDFKDPAPAKKRTRSAVALKSKPIDVGSYEIKDVPNYWGRKKYGETYNRSQKDAGTLKETLKAYSDDTESEIGKIRGMLKDSREKPSDKMERTFKQMWRDESIRDLMITEGRKQQAVKDCYNAISKRQKEVVDALKKYDHFNEKKGRWEKSAT